MTEQVLRAIPDIHCEPSRKAFARMEGMATNFALPVGTAWLPARCTDTVSGLDAPFLNDLPDRNYARVGIITDQLHARDLVDGFGLTKRGIKRDPWDPMHFVDKFYKVDDLEDGYDAAGDVAVWAKRSRAKLPEAFLLCRRKLAVTTWTGRSLILRYQLYGEYAYVTPKARRRGLGGAMAIAVAEQAEMDIKAIRRDLDRLPARGRPKLETMITGEAHSDGGEWILDRLLESVENCCEVTGFPGIECEADYSR